MGARLLMLSPGHSPASVNQSDCGRELEQTTKRVAAHTQTTHPRDSFQVVDLQRQHAVAWPAEAAPCGNSAPVDAKGHCASEASGVA